MPRNPELEDLYCVVEGCEQHRRFPRVKDGPDEVCHEHATLPYPDGPWREKQEKEILALDDPSFLDAIDGLPLGMYVVGNYDVTDDFLRRLVAMADARQVLREVEWAGEAKSCPSCGGFKPGEPIPSDKYQNDHYEDCDLARVLKA